MAQMTGFKVFKGTKQAFIESGKDLNYKDAIVFITGGDDKSKSCIYAQETYFANFAEFMSAYVATMNYVKGVNVGGQSYNAAEGGGYVAFVAKDPETIEVNVENGAVEIGLNGDFVEKVDNTASALGSSADSADKDGSAFARIANLAALVSDLTGGSTDSIEGQINTAIDALRTEITGTLDETDAKTLATINDELDGFAANYLKSADQVVKSVSTIASHGVALTHNEGTLGLSVTPGAVSENNSSVVTGGAVYTAIEAVKADAKSYSIALASEEELATLGENVKEAYKLVDEDSTKVGEYIKIYKDSALKSVELVAENAEGVAGQYLKYTYIKADGSEEVVYVNVSEFLVQAEFKNGLEVNAAGEVSVKISEDSEFLTIDEGGIKVSGVSKAISDAISSVPVPNWNAGENEAGYIENRTHYFGEKEYDTSNVDGVSDNLALDYFGETTVWLNGKNGPYTIVLNEENGYRWTDNVASNMELYEYNNKIFIGFIEIYDDIIKVTQNVIKQLDDKYIPDSIARTSEVTAMWEWEEL